MKRIIIIILIMLGACIISPTLFASSPPITLTSSQMNYIEEQSSNLNPTVLKLGLEAYAKLHQEGYDKQQMLTIVDYSKPSTEPRLWVVDLKRMQITVDSLVAHGQNSGLVVPTSFSDSPRSLESSIGVYLTGDSYFGKDGYSLRLNGLDRGFNDNAAIRDIVIHPASYVSTVFARIHGRLGRSWGCLAVEPAVATPMINQIKNGTVVFAYYPDPNWLASSAYFRA